MFGRIDNNNNESAFQNINSLDFVSLFKSKLNYLWLYV